MKKAIVLYSGGLDSRLAVKLLLKQGYEVETIFFKLPFAKQKISKFGNVKLHVVDVCKGEELKDYLRVLKKGEHGRGTGFNPCVDCRIFILRKAKKLAEERGIEIIATGEVLGQRPMSQTKKAMEIIDKEIGFELKRPLVEAGFSGRSRKAQMELAKKFGIAYPSPGGGCLLCEKALAKRFKVLIENNLINEKTLPLVSIGRHFWIDGGWFVVGRNEKENKVIEGFEQVVKSGKGKPAVYGDEGKAKELQKAYIDKDVGKFERWKL